MENTTSPPFVERFERAVMQYVILSKAREGEVTKENLASIFRGNLQMSKAHLDACITELVKDGHLREQGNKYTVTDDGREDIQKVTNLVLELPNAAKGATPSNTPKVGQPQTVGGGASNTGSNQPGQTPKTGQPQTVGGGSSNIGSTQPGQPKGGPGTSSR